MHLSFDRFGELAASDSKMFPEMRLILVACSATLTEVCLEGLNLEHCFNDLKTRTRTTGCDLKVTTELRHVVTCLNPERRVIAMAVFSQVILSLCKQLRCLHISFEVGDKEKPSQDRLPPDGGELLMHLSAALPNLSTLLWRQSAHTPALPRTQHIFSDFIGSKPAERLPGCGMRVLQAEHCSFDCVPELPASLQILSLKNLGRGHSLREGKREYHSLFKKVSCLLQRCADLRELYILHTAIQCEPGYLDLPRLADFCPALRVLVLHVFMHGGQEVSPILHTSMQWPTTDAWS